MSYSLDVNLLLYSSDESSPFHSKALTFIEACSRRDEPLYLCYLVLTSYLRISTHPRIFTRPLTPDEALGNVLAIASLPQARLISERDGFLEIYRDATASAAVRANLVPDAHLAAVLRQHGVSTLYTSNVEDFRRVGFADARNPLV